MESNSKISFQEFAKIYFPNFKMNQFHLDIIKQIDEFKGKPKQIIINSGRDNGIKMRYIIRDYINL